MPSAHLDKIVQIEKFVYFSFYRVSGEEKALYIAANVGDNANRTKENSRNKINFWKLKKYIIYYFILTRERKILSVLQL